MASDPANFSDAPVSLAEVRSDRSQSAADWTPRDVLIATLRQIDAGEIAPTAMVLVWTTAERDSCYRLAAPTAYSAIGLLETAKLQIFANRRPV